MCAKKKKDCFLQVYGFEQWMDQFFVDPYASFQYPHGIRIDLLETEEAYILEANLPSLCQKDIQVIKTKDSLRIVVTKHPDCILERDIYLPINVMYKKMNATFDNGLLEIHISKKETVQTGEHNILFTD